MLGTYSRDTAPFGPGLFPLRGPIGRLRNHVMNALHRRVVFGPVTRHYEDARRAVGLPSLGLSFIDTFLGDYLYLQSTVPSFEYPRSDLPPHVHFIGPLLAEPDDEFMPPRWWPELAGSKPVVLLTQGTVATGPDQLLVPAIRALADESVLVIATTAGPTSALLDAFGGALPANVRAERFVPYAQLMPHVDLLITNGGYGTVQQALAHGVPIVVAGATEDKPENAARVAWSSAGIRIKAQSPEPARLLAAVREALGQPRYRQRAQAIATEMTDYDAARTGTDLLEALARSGRPVLVGPRPLAPAASGG